MAADRDVVVAAVRAVDRSLPVGEVAALVEQITPRRELRRVLAGAVTTDRVWCTGSTTAPRVVDRFIAALVELGSDRFELPRCGHCDRVAACAGRRGDGARLCKACDARGRRAECVDCGRDMPVGKRLDDGTALCRHCFRKRPDRLRTCSRCGERRPVHAVEADGAAGICARCYMRRARGFGEIPGAVTARCVDCGREGFCVGISTGMPRCKRCYPRRTARCARCDHTGEVAVVWAGRGYCPRCRYHILEGVGTCEGCGQRRRVDPRNTDGRSLCSTCAGLDPLSVCTSCGAEARLGDRGRCSRCSVRRRLDALFEHAPVERSTQLAALRTAALDRRLIPGPSWLTGPSGRLLAQLLDGSVAVSHDALDAVGTRPAQHLRHVLVCVGVLAERDDQLAQLEVWLTAQLDAVGHPDDRHTIDTYANWHVLRRRRARAARTGTTGDTTAARRTIRCAINLLAWLRQHHRPLDEITQADIDLWVASGPAGRRDARTFLRWATARHLAPPVTIAVHRYRHPAATITPDDHQAFIARLVTDTTLAAVDRTAGLLIALYGQPATRLVRLRVDDVTIHHSHVSLALGRNHVELPPVLARLVTDLIDEHPDRTAQRWLFPGGQPGRHLTADWLAARVAAHGLPVRTLRTNALLELAAELPAAFLADLLGISTHTAVRWTQAAGGEWAHYAATRARTTRR